MSPPFSKIADALKPAFRDFVSFPAFGIRSRLALGLAGVAFLIVFVGGASYVTNQSVSRAINHLQRHAVEEKQSATAMKNALVGLRDEVQKLVLEKYRIAAEKNAPGSAHRIADMKKSLFSKAADLQNKIALNRHFVREESDGDAEENRRKTQILDRIEQKAGEYQALLREFSDTRDDDFERAAEFKRRHLLPLYESDLLPLVESFESDAGRQLENEVAAVESALNYDDRLILATTFAAFGLVLTVGFFFARSLSKPVSQLKAAAVKIGEGDFDTRVNVTRRDELGLLGGAFNKMAEQIAARTSKLETELSERNRTEAALRGSEAEYRALVQASAQFVWTVDEFGNADDLQKWWQTLTGQSPAESKGWGWFDALHEEDREETKRAWKAAFFQRRMFETEYRIRLRDGEYRWYAMRAVPVEGREGSKKWVGTMTDVTERRQQADALRKSEQFENLFRLANDAILIFEPKTEIVLNVNDKACEVYGLSRPEFIGRSLKEISADVARGEEQLDCLLDSGAYQSFESVQYHSSGAPINFLINSSIIEYEDKPAVLSINRDITERKRAEEKLQNSLSILTSIFEATDDGILVIDPSNVFVSYNRNFARMWGIPLSELEARANHLIKDRIVALLKDPDAFFKGVQEIQENPDVVRRDMLDLVDGRIYERYTQPQFLDGEIVGRVYSFRDITARVRSEEAVRDREEHFRSVVSSAQDAIISSDSRGRIVFWNAAAQKIFGYTEEEVIGRPLTILMPPSYMRGHQAAVRRHSETSETKMVGRRVDVHGRRKDGTEIPIDISTSTWETAKGKFFTAVIRDVTERRQAEEEMLALASIVASSHDAIIGKTMDGVITSWNNGARRIFGYEASEAVGRHISILFPPDRLGEEEQIINAILAGSSIENFETERRRKDGSLIPVSLTVSPIKNAAGETIGVSKIAHDITERKAAEDNLLKEKNFTETATASLPGVFYVFDENGRYLRWNKNLELVTGYTGEEIARLHPLDMFGGEDREAIARRIEDVLANGETAVEANFLAKDGTETPYFFTGKRVVLDGKICIVGMGIDIAERKRAEQRLLHDAFHDGLTGLANRALFANHLQMAINRRHGAPNTLFAVLFLDFDRFKIINDSLGHAEGDKLLVQVARRLESVLRPGDLLARLGGDEFTILLGELNSEADAVAVAERIQSAMKNSFELGGRKVFTSASIGIALSRAGYDRAEEMLRDADIAMYRAKAQGKARHQVFDREMYAHAMSQLQLETEMRQALEQKDFLLHFQPIVNLETGSIVGFESLVRWRHHEHGMISPAEFIPLAEENGLILPLGRWILHESCRRMHEWQAANSPARNLTVSVNLSSKQFQQQDLSEQIASALAETGLDPRSLKLEITESHVMENSETAIGTLERLRALGVELSLDDFGTGYSSLSYLHRLPVSSLKIDRSFVNRMIDSEENSEIVRTIIRLAQNLKMQVVAEGVETEEQADYLRRLKCEYGQGYLFSRPLDAAEVEIFLTRALPALPPQTPVFSEIGTV